MQPLREFGCLGGSVQAQKQTRLDRILEAKRQTEKLRGVEQIGREKRLENARQIRRIARDQSECAFLVKSLEAIEKLASDFEILLQSETDLRPAPPLPPARLPQSCVAPPRDSDSIFLPKRQPVNDASVELLSCSSERMWRERSERDSTRTNSLAVPVAVVAIARVMRDASLDKFNAGVLAALPRSPDQSSARRRRRSFSPSLGRSSRSN